MIKVTLNSIFLNPTQTSCVDVSRQRNDQTVKTGQCHPGYKGKKCEKRESGILICVSTTLSSLV